MFALNIFINLKITQNSSSKKKLISVNLMI